VADERINDSRDEKTGLPIYSLYGEMRRPKPEQLKDLNAIVFDIQDIGARFYTYISTLGGVMEEAARAHVPVFVLDRPNPINGLDLEGPMADTDKLSFTAYHTIPVRHGLTVGELAILYNEERKIGCDLHIVKMREWKRSMWFDQTAQEWINPSPNMRSLNEATLYPGIGLLETTNLSVGRGTDTPFEKIGAPWIDGTNLSTYLNARAIPGVRFIPIRFTPSASVYKMEECRGIQIIITDRDQLKAIRLGVEIASALRNLYRAEWKIDSYLNLLANQNTFNLLKRGEKVENILPTFEPQIEEFKKRREKILLY
ncbi:MAG: exo-beta-N-acetylmuramidase NamZ family protein, partial [Pyrinomonadaceae bacterium]